MHETQQRMEEDRVQRLKAIQREKEAFERRMREENEQELARMEDDHAKQLAEEKERQEKSLAVRRERMERELEEARRAKLAEATTMDDEARTARRRAAAKAKHEAEARAAAERAAKAEHALKAQKRTLAGAASFSGKSWSRLRGAVQTGQGAAAAGVAARPGGDEQQGVVPRLPLGSLLRLSPRAQSGPWCSRSLERWRPPLLRPRRRTTWPCPRAGLAPWPPRCHPSQTRLLPHQRSGRRTCTPRPAARQPVPLWRLTQLAPLPCRPLRSGWLPTPRSPRAVPWAFGSGPRGVHLRPS